MPEPTRSSLPTKHFAKLHLFPNQESIFVLAKEVFLVTADKEKTSVFLQSSEDTYFVTEDMETVVDRVNRILEST